MSLVDLHQTAGLVKLFIAISFTTLCAALNDTAEAEYRIELLSRRKLPAGSTCYTVGYSLGKILASSCALLIAYKHGWKIAYLSMTIPILLGMITVSLKKHQPRHFTQSISAPKVKNQRMLQSINNLLTYSPSKWLFLLILMYYTPSYLLLMVTNPFYLHLGFTTAQIGFINAILSIPALLIGGFLGGYFCHRYSNITVLYYAIFGYIASIILLLLVKEFSYLHSKFLLTSSIGFTNLVDSLSVVAYVNLIAGLCNVPFTASQNAFLTSMMALTKIFSSSLGGLLSQSIGYISLFYVSLLVLLCLAIITKLIHIKPLKQQVNFQAANNFPSLK